MATTTKFGLSQLNCKTPDFAHWIPQLYMLLSVSGMGMMTALHVSTAIEQNVAGICLAFSPLFILIGQMFGVNLKAQSTTAQPIEKTDDTGGSTDVGGSNPPPTGLPPTP